MIWLKTEDCCEQIPEIHDWQAYRSKQQIQGREAQSPACQAVLARAIDLKPFVLRFEN